MLALESAGAIASEPDAFDAPPPPKMLQGSQQRASYTRSATPVPRARRPGRSLISGAEPNYTPPAVEEPTHPPEPQGMAYGDEEQLVETEPEELLSGEPEEDWDADDGLEPEQRHASPIPAPPAPASAEVSITRAELAAARAREDLEDEDEAVAGMGVWALVGLGFVSVAAVAALGLFTVGTFLVPDGGEPTVEPAPAQHVAIEPAPKPVEPAPLKAVAPEPSETDGVANVGSEGVLPVEPEPTEEPQPTQVPAPLQPAPVRGEGVDVRPQPNAQIVTVSFESVPSSAMLYVDGRSIATTPFNHPVPEGPHRIRIEKEGFEPHAARVNISAGTNLYQVSLTPLPGTVLGPEPDIAPPPPEPPPAPAPATEVVSTMVFAPNPVGAVSMQLIWRGNRVSMPATIPYPTEGATLVFEMTDAEGEKWKSAVKCGPPNININKLVVAQACGKIQGKL